MAPATEEMAQSTWRLSKRLWCVLGLVVALTILYSAISQWQDDHLVLVNRTDSLPNWAFVIDRTAIPVRGDFVFFAPPRSALLRRHFGARPEMFGKIVYGMPGDVVAHVGRTVVVDGRAVGRTKPMTKRGEPLAIGPSGSIPAGCFYVGTPHPDGFDSRYAAIGFVCRRQIIGTGTAIL